MTKWLFLGDDSRIFFVAKLLQIPPEKIEKEKSLTVRRGENIFSQETDDEENLIFSSYFVPPETEIFLPTYSNEINFEEKNFDNCAIFEKFPFGTDSTENFAKLMKNYPATLFVMSDIVEGEENSPVGLNAVKEIYQNKNRDVLIFRDESDILKILHWHKPLAADIINLLRLEFEEILNRVENVDGEYKKFLREEKKSGCLSDSAKNNITSFAVVKGQSHIWKSYKNSALKNFFPVKNFLELYRRTLYQNENSLASMIWNISADCAKLEEKLEKKFEEVFQTPKKFQSLINSGEMYSEHMYRSLIRRGGKFGEIDKVFFSTFENFFRNEAHEIFISELKTHTEYLRSCIHGFRN